MLSMFVQLIFTVLAVVNIRPMFSFVAVSDWSFIALTHNVIKPKINSISNLRKGGRSVKFFHFVIILGKDVKLFITVIFNNLLEAERHFT